MNANAMSTLSVIEFLWIIITLFGLVVSAANSIDSFDSSEVANKAPAREPGEIVLKQIKVAIAVEHVRAEGIYLGIHSLFFVIGFVAALTPPAPRVDSAAMSAPMILAAIVVPIAFFAVQIAMIANSVQVRKTRKHIISLRALSSLSTESKGTFGYKDTVGQPGEGTGTFSMKTESTRDATSRRRDDPPASTEVEAPLPPASPPE